MQLPTFLFSKSSVVGLIGGALALSLFVTSFGETDESRVPDELGAMDGRSIMHCSLQESRIRVKECAPLMRSCFTSFGTVPYHTYSLPELLNSAISLSTSGDPDAEYITGWIYESGISHAHPTGVTAFLDEASNSNYFSTIVDLAVHANEHDLESANKWYARARAHGSKFAGAGISRCKLRAGFTDEAIEWARIAVKDGDVDANIELGQLYEAKSMEKVPSYAPGESAEALNKKAMSLYEQAALQADTEDTANWAISSILYLWANKQVVPSAQFSMGAKDPFELLSRYDVSGVDKKKYFECFSFTGMVPDPYAEYRSGIFAKLRHTMKLVEKDRLISAEL